jgi:hypothetical protein
MCILDLDFVVGVHIKYIIMHGCTNRFNGLRTRILRLALKKGVYTSSNYLYCTLHKNLFFRRDKRPNFQNINRSKSTK